MSVTLLQRWLEHYDPIHRGWTAAGIANGVCATCGFFFPRVAGGHNLYRGLSVETIDREHPVGAAGVSSLSIQTFPWIGYDPGKHYVYCLTAVSGGGCECAGDDATAEVAFDEAGKWLGRRPNAPGDLRIEPWSEGRFRLCWTYIEEGQQDRPAVFNLYHDSGSGRVNDGEVIATVPYREGMLHYSYLSGPFEHGRRMCWAVRAVSEAGIANDGGGVVQCEAIASVPSLVPTVWIG